MAENFDAADNETMAAEYDGPRPLDDEGDDLLDVADLVRMFEEAEEATIDSRKDSERDRDYVDNKQLTAEELETLRKRGQPPVIDNRIKTKIDFLVGLEKTQRIKPKALPRTPVHETDADAAGQAMRYVTDAESYPKKRSAVWRNLLVEGAGGISVIIEPSKGSNKVSLAPGPMPPQPPTGPGPMPMAQPGAQPMAPQPPPQPQQEFDVVITRIPWDRMFADPHSAESDYEDASYKGIVIWMDYADALAKYGPESVDALDATLQESGISDTYDDKPKFALWADRKRRRVRIVQIWIKRDDQWHFAEFTKCGILKGGPSPYVTDRGESDCPLIFQSAYVDRDNERYGLVREMISLQDEVNKRRSKALHLLNSAQIVMEDGSLSSLNDVEKVRKEAAKPDGIIVLAPSNGTIEEKFKFNTRTDLAEGQFKLLTDSKNSIDLKGPSATTSGVNSASASGKAIIASQQGGMMEIGDLMDNLRDLDRRVFRAIWARIRQFWTAEKWVRVTDDEHNVKWVGINVDREQLQMAMQQNPQIAKKIAGAVSNVAELDCDIIIDEAPDSLTPQLEQFQALAALKQYDQKGELPFRAIVQAAPNLKDKDKILELMDKAKQPPTPQAQQEQQAVKQLQFRGAAAKVSKDEADAKHKLAQAARALHEVHAPPLQPQPQPAPAEPLAQETALAKLENIAADTLAKRANAELTTAKARETGQNMALAPLEFAADQQDRAAQAQQPQQPPQAA